MKLLIITQKVSKNDPILGFFHRWIVEFAKHCESVIVICLEKGADELPANVRVMSLGKEEHASRLKYLYRFYSFIWKERNNYDVVFVHMNPIYVVLGGPVWKILGKNISLWYTHKSVDWKLKIAEKFVDKIFTASKESLRLQSKKVIVTGHGIDTEMFYPTKRNLGDTAKVLSVSRISPVKNQLIMIEAVKLLKQQGVKCELRIVGGALTKADKEYEAMIRDFVLKNNLSDMVKFAGPISPENTVEYYHDVDIFLNLSKTGSLDKAVLEAMACGIVPLTSNEAFQDMFRPYNLFLVDVEASIVAERVVKILSDSSKLTEVGGLLNAIVVRNHNLPSLISRVISEYR